MQPIERDTLVNEIQALRTRASNCGEHGDRRSVEGQLLRILRAILMEDMSVSAPNVTQRATSETDALYDLTPPGVGLQISSGEVRRKLVQKAVDHVSNLDWVNRLMVFGLSGFTGDAVALAEQAEPVKIELMDFDRLISWVSHIRLDEEPDPEKDPLYIVIQDFSRRLIKMVVEDPSILEKLEWRRVEETLAEVCVGLGFDEVELTPPAKNGGKDIVARCWIVGKKRRYFVEVKHWIRNKVGSDVVRDFVTIVVHAGADKGLILATTGYTATAFEGLTEFERLVVRAGNGSKMLSLFQTYIRVKSGLYKPTRIELPGLLFNGTLPTRD